MTVTVPNRRPPPKVASEVRKELKASEKQRVEIRAELERSIDLLEVCGGQVSRLSYCLFIPSLCCSVLDVRIRDHQQ